MGVYSTPFTTTHYLTQMMSSVLLKTILVSKKNILVKISKLPVAFERLEHAKAPLRPGEYNKNASSVSPYDARRKTTKKVFWHLYYGTMELTVLGLGLRPRNRPWVVSSNHTLR